MCRTNPTRVGVRVVVELKRDATAEVVLNQLFGFTPMQTSFACNMLALNGGRPEQLTLRDFLTAFLSFREEVIARRTAFELNRRASAATCSAVSPSRSATWTRSCAPSAPRRCRAGAREAHGAALARGRHPALSAIHDPTHKPSPTTYNLSGQVQARAILELRLERPTQLGVKEVTDELEALAAKIKEYLEIGAPAPGFLSIISDELRDRRELFAVPRRTEITHWSGDMDDEDLIEREDVVVHRHRVGLRQADAPGRVPQPEARWQGQRP